MCCAVLLTCTVRAYSVVWCLQRGVVHVWRAITSIHTRGRGERAEGGGGLSAEKLDALAAAIFYNGI